LIVNRQCKKWQISQFKGGVFINIERDAQTLQKIAGNIRRICAAKGVAPVTACSLSGAGGNLLNRLERGASPNIMLFIKLADYLGVTLDDLAGGPGEDRRMQAGRMEKELAQADELALKMERKILKKCAERGFNEAQRKALADHVLNTLDQMADTMAKAVMAEQKG
jgi:transcriptional regulator with XRE-family HTH domain